MDQNRKTKSNSIVGYTVNHDGTIAFRVIGRPGELPLIRVFSPSRASLLTRTRAATEGWIKRIGNAAAISRNEKTGLSATPEEKFEAICRLIDHYETGTDDWATRGKVEKEKPQAEWVLRALVALEKARDLEHAGRILAATARKLGLDIDATVAKLWKTSDIGGKIAELKAKERVYSLSSDDLLADELEDGGNGENLESL